MWYKHVLFLVVLAVASLNHRPVFGQNEAGDSCYNSRGKSGVCLGIKSCPPFLKLLRLFKTDARDFLTESVCGFQNGQPVVCCPVDEIQNRNVQSAYGPLLSPVCGWTDAHYPKVIGGVPASLGTWPWAALLGYRGKDPRVPRWLCGGALISARHVLSAAHCVYGHDELYKVRLGELDLGRSNESPIIDCAIDRKTIHPDYDPATHTSDIAVLRLDRDIQFSDYIKPICLPVTDDIQSINLGNAFPFIVGWGSISYQRNRAGPTSNELQQLQVPYVPQNQCKAAFRSFPAAKIDERVLCAGYAVGGKDACQGDSGGPMMYPIGKTWYSIGIVSYGYKCAEPGFPGVYTRTLAFLDFIIPLLN